MIVQSSAGAIDGIRVNGNVRHTRTLFQSIYISFIITGFLFSKTKKKPMLYVACHNLRHFSFGILWIVSTMASQCPVCCTVHNVSACFDCGPPLSWIFFYISAPDCWYCFVLSMHIFVVYLARSLEIWPETYLCRMHHAIAEIIMMKFSTAIFCSLSLSFSFSISFRFCIWKKKNRHEQVQCPHPMLENMRAL